MTAETLLLLCLNFLFIGALPRIFFKKGSLAPMWWATALPLFISPLTAVLIFFDLMPLFVIELEWARWLSLAGIILNAASIALIALTIGSNRIPLALWHQKDDAPQQIVTFGAYKYVRHPFYTAFLLALLSAVLHAPHLLTLLTLVYGLVILNATAAREEKRLAASELGEEYRSYMQRTGRFLPRMGRE
ncbi:MAG: isoprenylcysteine carboxylmethyltransferase family protein [Acidobacteria bacterium]|nr:isoprenylcysteine carboxylmethyltransferase family protein [Acidobacteriota bacterium]